MHQGRVMDSPEPAADHPQQLPRSLSKKVKKEAKKQRRRGKKISEQGQKILENYIPLRFNDLMDELVSDHPTVFNTNTGLAPKWQQLSQQVSLRNQIRLAEEAQPMMECYSRVDPDVDAETPPEILEAKFSPQRLKQLGAQFESHLEDLLAKGGFEPVPDAMLQAALNEQGAMNGLSVEVPGPEDVYYKLWYRGLRTVTVWRRPWWRLFMRTPLHLSVFQRFALLFKVVTEDVGQLNKQEAWWQRLLRPFHRKRIQVMVAPGTGANGSSTKVDSNWAFLKLFKDIDVADVDMLLPGSVAKFSWFDHLMIWGPILFGVGSAIYKSVQGTVDFSNVQQAMASILLIILPLTWGVRAYFAVKQKQAIYEAHLNKLYLLHNLNNNAGVVSQIIDEANEQEDNEAMLAYFFLWRGQHNPLPMDQPSLDAAVEEYLNNLVSGIRAAKSRPQSASPGPKQVVSSASSGTKRPSVGGAQVRALSKRGSMKQEREVRIDFEVSDAVHKLLALGLVRQLPAAPGQQPLLQAVDLETALELSSMRNYTPAKPTVKQTTSAADAGGSTIPAYYNPPAAAGGGGGLATAYPAAAAVPISGIATLGGGTNPRASPNPGWTSPSPVPATSPTPYSPSNVMVGPPGAFQQGGDVPGWGTTPAVVDSGGAFTPQQPGWAVTGVTLEHTGSAPLHQEAAAAAGYMQQQQYNQQQYNNPQQYNQQQY